MMRRLLWACARPDVGPVWVTLAAVAMILVGKL